MADRLVVTPEEAAELLGVTRSTVYGLISTGALPSVKLGRFRRILITRIEDFLERTEAEQNDLPRKGKVRTA